MIEEDHVSYEIAKLLKEKGFKQTNKIGIFVTKAVYKISPDSNSKHDVIYCYSDRTYNKNKYIAAPTHQMVLKWLREVHNLWCEITPEGNHTWCVDAYSLIHKQFVPGSIVHRIKSYEEATETIIKYCLENLNCHEDLI